MGILSSTYVELATLALLAPRSNQLWARLVCELLVVITTRNEPELSDRKSEHRFLEGTVPGWSYDSSLILYSCTILATLVWCASEHQTRQEERHSLSLATGCEVRLMHQKGLTVPKGRIGVSGRGRRGLSRRTTYCLW